MFNTELINSIKERMLKRRQTISVAESVTSGLLQCAFSMAQDAAQFYQGGITAYNVPQKYRHLGVEPIHALSVNAVSEEVAAQMAMNVCRLFNSHWGIGITGYASPVPESGNSLFAFYAIVFDGETVLAGKSIPIPQAPFDVQLFYMNDVLSLLDTRLALF